MTSLRGHKQKGKMNKHAYSFSVFVSSPTEFESIESGLFNWSSETAMLYTRCFDCLLLWTTRICLHSHFHGHGRVYHGLTVGLLSFNLISVLENLHFRRDLNAYLCGVERRDKMNPTLSFRSGRNFQNFGLDAQAASNVPFKTFINSFDSFLHSLPREQNMRTRCITYAAWLC